MEKQLELETTFKTFYIVRSKTNQNEDNKLMQEQVRDTLDDAKFTANWHMKNGRYVIGIFERIATQVV